MELIPRVVLPAFRKCFYIPWVDLFASRLKPSGGTSFVSWKPEPEAWAVDVLSRVLSKIKEDNTSGIFGGAPVAYTAVVPGDARSVDRSSLKYRNQIQGNLPHPGKSTLAPSSQEIKSVW